MDFKIFQNELKNYNKYKKSIRQLEEKIDDICYKYCGVRGVSFDRQITTPNPSLTETKLIKMSIELEEPQRELDHTLLKIQDIERNLSKLPNNIREMALMLYADGYSYHYVGVLNGYSHNGVYKLMRREIEKI